MTPPEPAPIREWADVDAARFEAEIRPLGRPAVLRGLAAGWPAVRAAQMGDEALVAYLRRFAHDRAVGAIVGEPGIGGRFFYTDDLAGLNFTRGRSPLGPFLDRLLRDRTAARPYAMAIQSAPAPELLPGFAEENASPLPPAATVPRLWFGNAVRVATHYDLMENVGVVIAGRRRFTLFPPDQLPNLYMGPLEPTPAGTPVSLVDAAAPDLDRFPRFTEALAAAEAAVLEPGDALYIPFHWWHAVDSLAPVNLFANYWWNPAPSGMVNPYDALMLALFSLRTLPPDQRRAWRTMFDHLVFQTGGDPAAHLPPAVRGVLGPADADGAARMRATIKASLDHVG